jgi:drug/metabolite transporter (DMT)-like permease
VRRVSSRSSHLLPLLCLAGAVVFWGTGYGGAKAALDSFSPMTVVWLRMVVATLVFAPFWHRLPKPDYRKGDWKVLALIGLLMPCLYYFFEGYALHFTTSSQAGVVSALSPLFVGIGAWLFFREHVGTRQIVAIVVSLAGVAMLSFGGVSQAAAPNPMLGGLLEFMAIVSGSGWMLAVKYLGPRYNPWLLTGGQAAVGAVAFLPLALASGSSQLIHATPQAWGCIVYLAIVVTLAAFGLYNMALTMMPASRASIAINLVPVVALLTGWLVLGETMSALQLLACAVVLGAVVLGESDRYRREAAESLPAASPDGG